MFAFKHLTLCFNVQELFPASVQLLLALWAPAPKSLGSDGLWSLIIKAAIIQLRRVKLEMNPAADGGVSSRGVTGTVEPHSRALHRGLHNQLGNNTMCLRNNKGALSLSYFHLFKEEMVFWSIAWPLEERWGLPREGDLRLIFQFSSGGTFTNDFIFLLKKRRGFFHSVFCGAPTVQRVPNAKRSCTQMNAISLGSFTIFSSCKGPMSVPY